MADALFSQPAPGKTENGFVQKQLAAILVGSTACVAYGMTRAFGYGLPPYSFIYAAALGLVVGVATYGTLSIKTPWKRWTAVAAIGALILGFGALSYAKEVAQAEADRRARDARATQIAALPTTVRAEPKPTTAPAATRQPRQCDDPQQLTVQATLRRTTSGVTTTTAATGTVRNTCNYALTYRLEARGLKEDGSVAAVKTGVTQTLQPGQESAFAQTVEVAYTPHSEPSPIASVQVSPLIQP